MTNIVRNLSNGIKIYVCDTVEDLNKIEIRCAAMGSRCYCIDDNNLYILNGAKEWKKMPKNISSSSSSSSNDDTTEVIYDGGEVK